MANDEGREDPCLRQKSAGKLRPPSNRFLYYFGEYRCNEGRIATVRPNAFVTASVVKITAHCNWEGQLFHPGILASDK
jgi:hypothetical protein